MLEKERESESRITITKVGGEDIILNNLNNCNKHNRHFKTHTYTTTKTREHKILLLSLKTSDIK